MAGAVLLQEVASECHTCIDEAMRYKIDRWAFAVELIFPRQRIIVYSKRPVISFLSHSKADIRPFENGQGYLQNMA